MRTITLSGLLRLAAVLVLPVAAFGSDKQHCYLRDAMAPAGSTAYLMCEQGLVYVTTDGGATWAARDTGAAQLLHAVYFSDATHGFVVGDQGTLLATADGGKTWQARTSGTTEHLLAIYALGNQAWASGFDGTLLYSADGGVTWVKQKSGTTMSLEGLYFLDPDHGWAVGWSGTILRTTDGGKKWETIKTDAASWSLAAVHFRDLKNGWATGFLGELLRSRDGGATWEAEKSPTPSELTSVTLDRDNHVWVAADDQILESDDGDQFRSVPVENHPFIAKLFPLGGSMWALGELGLFKQTAAGQWKRDENFVPAGARIGNSLDDAVPTAATDGKSK
jgi:photosystem II stability/assembly factor-like uncharacterized protein